MGISAGRTLAASVILRELEESRELKIVRPLITVALLGIPWLIHIDSYPLELFKSPEVSAKLQSAEAPVIPTQRLKLFSDLLGVQDVTDSTNVIYVCLVRDFSAINAHSPHHIAINQCMYTIRSEAIHQQKTS
jgi:hypothetical protein